MRLEVPDELPEHSNKAEVLVDGSMEPDMTPCLEATSVPKSALGDALDRIEQALVEMS